MSTGTKHCCQSRSWTIGLKDRQSRRPWKMASADCPRDSATRSCNVPQGTDVPWTFPLTHWVFLARRSVQLRPLRRTMVPPRNSLRCQWDKVLGVQDMAQTSQHRESLRPTIGTIRHVSCNSHCLIVLNCSCVPRFGSHAPLPMIPAPGPTLHSHPATYASWVCSSRFPASSYDSPTPVLVLLLMGPPSSAC